LKKRKKKRQRRNDLREEKAKYRVGEVTCTDTKDLSDIPAYWTQMKQKGLPAWQYTHREVKCGLMFLGYGEVKSLAHATVFAEVIAEWYERHGVKTQGSRWQHDEGSEFIGSWNTKKKSGFIRALENRKIESFPIPKVTYNADVETVHNTIELEFFDIEQFRDREEFFIKASTYQRWYNLLRKNSYRKNRSPWDIIQETEPGISPQIVTLPAIDLDQMLRDRVSALSQRSERGYHVPGRAHLCLLIG
jgi:hypothetical protein